MGAIAWELFKLSIKVLIGIGIAVLASSSMFWM
jgi:hypothetical protein